MMALSMVVIASMIGTRGLGDEVLLGLQQLNVGRAAEAGIAIPASAARPTFNCCRPKRTSSPKPLVPIIDAITTIDKAIIVHNDGFINGCYRINDRNKRFRR